MSCIEHTQKGCSGGYARANINGRTVGLHRAVYIRHHGLDITAIDGKVIRHTCDNPRCINPVHLVIGTQQDNMDDMVNRGRHVLGRRVKGVQVHTAVLTPEQVLYIREHYKPYSKDANQKTLAKQFNVDYTTIAQIVRRQTWKDI